jgi:ABC-type lipoprotein release transport system permease subunit
MIQQLIVNNVRRRPIRTIVSVIAVGVEVALVILIVGLTSGLLQETAKRIEGIGADIMLQPPSASVFLAFSGAPMPIKIGDKLREMKYVKAVAPVLLQFSSSGGVDVIYGIDPQNFRDVSGGFVFLEGHDMVGPDDILMDDWAAKGKNVKVGSIFRLLDHDFHVAGIVEHGKGARLFVPIGTLQDLSGSRDKAPAFHVYNRDRKDARHRNPEIYRRIQGIHHPGPTWGIGFDLCDWHPCRHCDELRHTGPVSFRIPDLVDSDYAGMDSAVCCDRRGWRFVGCKLSGLAREPQGRD